MYAGLAAEKIWVAWQICNTVPGLLALGRSDAKSKAAIRLSWQLRLWGQSLSVIEGLFAGGIEQSWGRESVFHQCQ
jgi:hypothetical protein